MYFSRQVDATALKWVDFRRICFMLGELSRGLNAADRLRLLLLLAACLLVCLHLKLSRLRLTCLQQHLNTRR